MSRLRSRRLLCDIAFVVFICLGTRCSYADVRLERQIDQPASSVVKLFGAGLGNLDSYGSGTLVSPEGHVVTVWNHLVNSGYLTAVTSDGQRYQLKVVGTSAKHDLAVLQLEHDGNQLFPCIDLGDALRPVAGSEVRAFSNMFHVATGNEPVSVVHGIVAADAKLSAGLGRWEFPLESPVLILDAITNNSGAAGGLLTDFSGRPVGVLGRELRHTASGTWVNYAVPFATLNPVIKAIRNGESVAAVTDQQTVNPVSYRQLTERWGMTLLPDVLKETPAYIDNVTTGSLTGRAGLRRGDLVVMVDDAVIQTGAELRTQLARIRSGLRLTIIVDRDGALVTMELRAP